MKLLDHLEEWLISVPDGRGDVDHLRRGAASLRGWLCDPRRAGLAARPELRLGAGALHHHVRVDGQVRRRLRRAHRHPRRRRRDDQPPAAAHARRASSSSACSPAHSSPASSARSARPSSGRSAPTTRSSRWLGLATGDLPEGPTTPDLEVPTWIVYSAVPLGSYLMCFRFLQVTWAFLRTGELPHHDHGQVEGIEEEDTPLAPAARKTAIYRMAD